MKYDPNNYNFMTDDGVDYAGMTSAEMVITADAKMTAVSKAINENPDKQFAVIVMAAMWSSIEVMLNLANVKRGAEFDRACEHHDLMALGKIANDTKPLAVATVYRARSERYLGMLIAGMEAR
jgi:hypothetical protein